MPVDINQEISRYKKAAFVQRSAANAWNGVSSRELKYINDKIQLLDEFVAILTGIKDDQAEMNSLTLPTKSIASSSVKH
jgi:hypothetical protein